MMERTIITDEVLFVLIAVIGSFIMMFGMISSRQKIQIQSSIQVAFGVEDTIVKNVANVLVDGWHVETRYSLTIVTAVAGGDIAYSVLTTSKPLTAVVGDNPLGVMAMPKEADAGGAGSQLSAMASIMPSTVFIDPSMTAQTSFILKKTSFIEVEKTEKMEFLNNFGSQNATITAGVINVTAIAVILVGAYLKGGRKRSQGTEVVIHAVDIGNTLKFGAWRPFCDGRMGNIRATVFTEGINSAEILYFGPSVGIDIPQAEQTGEIVLMPDGDLVSVRLAGLEGNTSYIYVTNFERGPWFVDRDQNIAWAMDDAGGSPSRIMLEFTFIPNFNAKFQIDYKWRSIEIGTPDFEEHFTFPFDCKINTIKSQLAAIGTVVGVVVIELHLVKATSSIIPTFVGSEQVLDGNLMGTRDTVSRVMSSTKKQTIYLEVFPRETASGVFTGVDAEAEMDRVDEEYDSGSAIVIFAQAIDATTISFIQGDTRVSGVSKVKSNQYAGNFIESLALVMQEEAGN